MATVTNEKNQYSYKFDLAHLAWIFAFISFYNGFFKDREVQEAIEAFSTGNIIRISTVIISGFLSLCCILSRKNGVLMLFRGPQKWLLIYGIIAIVSGVYASHSSYAIWKSLEIIADVLIIGAILSSYDANRSARGLYEICVCVFLILLFSVWIGVFVAPNEAFIYARGILPIQIQGVWPIINPNPLAFISAFLLIAFISKTHDKVVWVKILYSCVAMLAGLTLILTQSRTSVLGCMVALLIYSVLAKNKILLYASIIVFITLMLWGAGSQIGYDYLRRGQSAGSMKTLTGRTVAWNAAMKSFWRSPLLGNGFASAGRFDVLGGGAMSTLHGSVFDILVGVGIIGFVPWMLGVLSTTWRLGMSVFRYGVEGHNRIIRAEAFSVMVLIIIRSTTSSVLALHDLTFLLFTILVSFSWIWTANENNKLCNIK